MNVRELLWAATYGWNRWAFRGNERAREIALDEATESVADFDEFFWDDPADAPPPKEVDEGAPEPLDPLECVGAWEITDPITWEIDVAVHHRWCQLQHWPLDDTRAPAAIRQVIKRSHYVKTLGANRELWRTSRHAGGWRLVVEPREAKPSLVVWIGQGAPPERFL